MVLDTDRRPKFVRYFEMVFNIAYLLTILSVAVYLLINAEQQVTYLWSITILVLFLGDAFHLIPRTGFAITGNTDLRIYMNFGKQITSISMTIFYLLLWYVGRIYIDGADTITTIAVIVLCVVRVILCVLPQNDWLVDDATNKFRYYRNIPFILLGCVEVIFFAVNSQKLPSSLEWMWLIILLSFVFYIPVILFAPKYPKLGSLMIPKTIFYVIIVFMGASA